MNHAGQVLGCERGTDVGSVVVAGAIPPPHEQGLVPQRSEAVVEGVGDTLGVGEDDIAAPAGRRGRRPSAARVGGRHEPHDRGVLGLLAVGRAAERRDIAEAGADQQGLPRPPVQER
jgi:hypothetical protein